MDSGTRDKVVFPAVYMKQNRYDLEIAFKMAGNKFQDKFKKIGSDLETTFFMDFMEVQDDIKFKTYKNGLFQRFRIVLRLVMLNTLVKVFN